jgi:sensor histidine kinase YesM
MLISYIAIAGLPYLLIHPAHDTGGRMLPSDHGFWSIVRGRFPQFLIVLMFSIMVKINSRWKESEQQKLTADLSFLKAQVNPHFLFNSLNSIYSLAIERSDKTASAVVKLSGMMRYVIVDAARDHVPLERELDYINDYVEMQKIRLGDTINFSYDVQIHTPGLTIAPLLLIPFVENAFKYGVNPEEDSMIRMIITTTDRNLILILENNKVVKMADQNLSSGIGLGNARNRLKLLYPGKHDLLIKEDNNKFNVYLAVTL